MDSTAAAMLPGEVVGGVDVAVAEEGLVGATYQRSCWRSLKSSTGLHESLFLTSMYTTETRPERRRRDGAET
jgi:hypothetical protein